MHTSASPPRTLTQMLREWDDDAVRELLRARPDLAFPPPTDFSQIASRATTRQSVTAALDELTSIELWVAQAACREAAAFTGDELARTLIPDDDAEVVKAAVRRLWQLGLLWGAWKSLRPVRAMAALLGDRVEAVPALSAPDFSDLPTQTAGLVDKVAAGSAFEFVRRIDVLVEHLDHHPARLTRAGAFASRDLRALAQLLDTSSALAQAHLEIARAAGLVGLAARELNEVLIPTTAFDAWQSRPLGEQWEMLAVVWLNHHPQSGSARLKNLCMRVFGDPHDARVVTAANLHTWLRWHRPRRPANADRQATTMVDQAAAIGVTGLGALASFAYPPTAAGLGELLPERVDHVLIQADLTAIAPGPLTAEAAHELGALADIESRGGATVYRFSPASLSRAQSLGWTANDILQTLRQRSRTPVPQPLEYQVRELDRLGRRPASTLGGVVLAPDSTSTHRPPERALPPTRSDDDLTPEQRLDEKLLAEVVAHLRHSETRPHEVVDPGTTSEHFWAAPLDTLREAVETREVVWLGYVDANGETRERVVHVVSVDEGQVTAEETSGGTITLPVHRISAAHIIRSQR
jgi:hypothetical protein